MGDSVFTSVSESIFSASDSVRVSLSSSAVSSSSADKIRFLAISFFSSVLSIPLARSVTSLGTPANAATSIPKLRFAPPRAIFRRKTTAPFNSRTVTL